MSTLRLAQQSWGEGGTALLSRSPEFFRVKLSTAQLTLGKHCGVVLVTLLEVVSPESANCCGIRMEVGTGFLPRAPLFRTNPPPRDQSMALLGSPVTRPQDISNGTDIFK